MGEVLEFVVVETIVAVSVMWIVWMTSKVAVFAKVVLVMVRMASVAAI